MDFQYKVLLVGNLIADTIYETKDSWLENTSNKFIKKEKKIGGLGNVLSAFNYMLDIQPSIISAIGNDYCGKDITTFIENNYSLFSIQKFSDINTSEALIISNIKESKRTSFVKWGACTFLNNINHWKNNWTHITYLDNLLKLSNKDIKSLRKQTDILSVDLCSSKPTKKQIYFVEKHLSNIDYLIISDIEALGLRPKTNLDIICKELGSKVIGDCIIHSPMEVLCSNGQTLIKTKNNYLKKNLNVLGAGDYWAASFIEYLISRKKIDILSLDLDRINKRTVGLLCRKNITF